MIRRYDAGAIGRGPATDGSDNRISRYRDADHLLDLALDSARVVKSQRSPPGRRTEPLAECIVPQKRHTGASQVRVAFAQ